MRRDGSGRDDFGRRIREGAVRRILDAARSEEGGMSMLSAGLVVTTMVMVGLAVDSMNSEYHRVQLQSACDRAVLAAANVDPATSPVDVVKSYFEAADLEDYLIGEPRVDLSDSSRTVELKAERSVPTAFLRIANFDEFNVAVDCGANESIPNIEISLVLDISGSMRFDSGVTGKSKMDMLRVAATQFSSLVLAGDRAERTTLTIVPYAGQVNPGPALFKEVGGSRWHDHSSCVVFESNEFSHTGLPDSSSNQVPHFMNWAIASDVMDWGWCPQDPRAILAFENDLPTIHNFIRDIRMHDGTGTHIGMKWGLALLDPASRGAVSKMRAANEAGPLSEDRPLDWNREDGLKVIVLMTDGAITDQYTAVHSEPVIWHADEPTVLGRLSGLKTDYRDLHNAGSGVDVDAMTRTFLAALADADDGALSVELTEPSGADDAVDYVDWPGTSVSFPAGLTAKDVRDIAFAADSGLDLSDSEEVQEAFEDGDTVGEGIVIMDHGLANLTKHVPSQKNHLGQTKKNRTQSSSRSTNVTHFKQICDVAKKEENRVIVYTVAFNVDGDAEGQMRYCASSINHFFDVRGADITDAFAAIAGQINELRLTQ